jgi:hypothetical protein
LIRAAAAKHPDWVWRVERILVLEGLWLGRLPTPAMVFAAPMPRDSRGLARSATPT